MGWMNKFAARLFGVKSKGQAAPSLTSATPQLSVVVIFFNMAREAGRTLATLSPDYQMGVSASDYEVIAVDNGSEVPLDAAMVSGFGPNFRLIRHEPDCPSPAQAVNLGAKAAKGESVAIIVDGARMLSPGTIRATLDALQTAPQPFVTTLAWHLGPDVQNKSMLNGYDQSFEDEMLAEAKWAEDGYRLFEISTLAQSSQMGLGGGFPHECSWFALDREHFKAIGGYDERFRSPGGGLVNHAFIQTVFKDGSIRPIVLMGEGSFHQYHGGVATNAKPEAHPWPKFDAEYKEIFGQAYDANAVRPEPDYVGEVHPLAARFKTSS